MIIGFDASRIVSDGAGRGSYARTLINDISAVVPAGVNLNLYAPDRGKDILRQQIKPHSNLRFVYPDNCICTLQKELWRMKGVVNDLRRDGVNIFHGLSGTLPAGLKKAGIRSVVTIHDIIFMRHPEYYSLSERMFLGWQFRRTCREADRIIAISECTKRDITLFGNVEPERIDVIYQSCGTRFKLRESEKKLQEVHTRYMLPHRYVVSVGTIEERKNILLAVKAIRLLPADISLVVVGRPTAYAAKVRQFINENGLQERVHILGDVPYDDLPAIYQMAEVSVYPSGYEGFGIPVIEAIQSGLPVVACTGSCLEESGGNDTIYVSPDDSYGMAEAIKSVLKGTPGREGRIERSLQYITRFEGNNVARQVIDVYNKL